VLGLEASLLVVDDTSDWYRGCVTGKFLFSERSILSDEAYSESPRSQGEFESWWQFHRSWEFPKVSQNGSEANDKNYGAESGHVSQ
jgi:hypothetical protein